MANVDATQSSANVFHDKSRELTAQATGPVSQAFNKLGTFGEDTVGKAIGGEKGNFVGQVFFDPIGAGASLLSKGTERQRDVSRVDPNQLARLREIDRTRKQIASGTDPLTQIGIAEARKSGATTQANLAKVTGGNVGGTISAFLRAQRNTNKAANQVFQRGQQRTPFFENLSTQLGNRISQRKLELDINAQDTQRAQQAQEQTNRNLNEEGRQASGGGGGQGGLLDLVKGFAGGDKLSNISGGGGGGAIGQGEGGLGGGLFNQGISTAGGGGGQGLFGQGLSTAGGGGGQGAFGQGIAAIGGGGGEGGAGSAISGIAGAGGGEGGAAAGEIIKKGISAIGSLF